MGKAKDYLKGYIKELEQNQRKIWTGFSEIDFSLNFSFKNPEINLGPVKKKKKKKKRNEKGDITTEMEAIQKKKKRTILL